MPHTREGGPTPLFSRQGREHQKYGDGGERLVAGCIPVRFRAGVEGPAAVEVLMITSGGGKGHVFPKGGWESDESLEAAAKRETVEEAGVRGRLEEPLLGSFPFYSNKAERLQTAHKGRCVAYIYVMHVTEELPTWPEAAQRTRDWLDLPEAYAMARYDWMRDALRAWAERKGWGAAALQRPAAPPAELRVAVAALEAGAPPAALANGQRAVVVGDGSKGPGCNRIAVKS